MSRLIRIALVFWIPAIAWMAVIFSLSSIPGQDLPRVDFPNADKIAHAVEYLILGFLLIRAISHSFQNISLAKIIISAIIIASSYAIFDEWHQQYIQGRECDFFDFLADFVGASIGIVLYKMRG